MRVGAARGRGRGTGRTILRLGTRPSGGDECERSSRARTSRSRSASARTPSASSAHIERILDDRTDAIVELSNEHHRSAADAHIVEVTLVINGQTLRSRATGSSYQAALDTVVDKVERQAVDHKERPRVRARPTEEKDHPAPDRRRHGRGRRRESRDRQEQALRHRADVRGGRHRRDGGARPSLLRLRQRRERAGRRSSTPATTATTASSSRSSAATTPAARRRANGRH